MNSRSQNQENPEQQRPKEIASNQNQNQNHQQKLTNGSPQQIFDWAERNPGWQGDDLEYCLEIVKNSRIVAEF